MGSHIRARLEDERPLGTRDAFIRAGGAGAARAVTPSKVFLATWYGRLGYRLVRTGIIEEAYPHLAPLLATPCDFEVYHKDLRARPH